MSAQWNPSVDEHIQMIFAKLCLFNRLYIITAFAWSLNFQFVNQIWRQSKQFISKVVAYILSFRCYFDILYQVIYFIVTIATDNDKHPLLFKKVLLFLQDFVFSENFSELIIGIKEGLKNLGPSLM